MFEVASSDLVNMGITVVSYTLKDIRDEEVSVNVQAYCTSVLQQNLHVSVSISRHIAEKGWSYLLFIAFIKYVFKMLLFIYVYLLARQQVFV